MKNWLFIVGKSLQLAGMVITFWVIIMFFGESTTKELYQMFYVGGGFFLAGWVVLRYLVEGKN